MGNRIEKLWRIQTEHELDGSEEWHAFGEKANIETHVKGLGYTVIDMQYVKFIDYPNAN
jgi:hypothetical protein